MVDKPRFMMLNSPLWICMIDEGRMLPNIGAPYTYYVSVDSRKLTSPYSKQLRVVANSEADCNCTSFPWYSPS